MADEVDRLGRPAVMVIASATERAFAERLAAGLPVALRHSEVVMHVPVEVADRARAAAAEHGVDLLRQRRRRVHHRAGQGDRADHRAADRRGADHVRRIGGHERLGADRGRHARPPASTPGCCPGSIVYDAALTLSLPVPMSVASGLNALAHCVDSMWAPRTDPIDQALAAEGIRALGAGPARGGRRPAGLDGREQTLYGAYLSAVAFASAGSGLHHKICHVLGGRYDLPHAQTHAVVLPYVLAFNAPAAPGRGAAHGRGVRRRPGHRRPAGPADPARRAAGAAGPGVSPRGHSRRRPPPSCRPCPRTIRYP